MRRSPRRPQDRGKTTKIRPGMCFTDEPGTYSLGESGIRHEDTVVVISDGCEILAPK